jgi:hypothetical protein
MIGAHVRTAVAVMFVVMTAGSAAGADVIGTVASVDLASRTIHFVNGLTVTLAPGAPAEIHGEPRPLESVTPGAVVIVRESSAAPGPDIQRQAAVQAAPVDQGQYPLIDASGVVASVDPENSSITFRDGRTVKLMDPSAVPPAVLGALHPGETVSVRRAEAVAFRNQDMNRLWMGTVARVEPKDRRVTLDDGTIVRVTGRTPVRFDDDQVPITDLSEGDEIVVWTRMRDQASDFTGSALPGQDVSRILEADRIQILRRADAP